MPDLPLNLIPPSPYGIIFTRQSGLFTRIGKDESRKRLVQNVHGDVIAKVRALAKKLMSTEDTMEEVLTGDFNCSRCNARKRIADGSYFTLCSLVCTDCMGESEIVDGVVIDVVEGTAALKNQLIKHHFWATRTSLLGQNVIYDNYSFYAHSSWMEAKRTMAENNIDFPFSNGDGAFFRLNVSLEKMEVAAVEREKRINKFYETAAVIARKMNQFLYLMVRQGEAGFSI